MQKQLLKTLGWVGLCVASGTGQMMAQTISNLTPNYATTADPSVTIVISGTGFESDNVSFLGSRVVFAAGESTSTLVPTTVSPTSITVTIPGSSLTLSGPATVIVQNISDGTQSSPTAFTIYPAPVITSLQLNPTPVNGVRALNVFGQNFFKGEVILIGAPGCTTLPCLQAINTTFNSATNIAGSLPASFIPVPGIYNVYVETPGGGLSNVSPLQVGLVIDTLTPATVSLNVNPPPVLTVTAESGLVNGYVIYFNGQPLQGTVIDSPTQAHVQLSIGNVGTLGAFPVWIQDQGGTIVSNTLQFNVVQAVAPAITSVAPNIVTAGDPPTYIAISGSHFQQDGSGYTGARIIFTPNGGAPTTLIPGTNTGGVVATTLPAALIATAGSATIAVGNVSDGAVSNPVTFTILARPVITSLTPNPIPAGSVTPLTVTGMNFGNTDKIMIGAMTCVSQSCLTPLTTTFNSSTSLSGNVPAPFINTTGAYNIFVMNVGNALSAPAQLTVGLSLLSLNPSSAIQNSPPPVVTLTTTGGLLSTSLVYFNGQVRPTTPISSTQVSAQLTPADVATAGVFPITVQNGSIASNALNFTVLSAQPPSIISVVPAGATTGDPNTVLTITGTNFAIDAQNYTGARVNFTPPGSSTPQVLVPTSNTGTVITVTVPQALLTTAGSAPITVSNVTDGKTSGAFSFTILQRGVITSVQLNPTPVGGTSALNVFGLYFNSDDKILIGPAGCSTLACLQPINTTFDSPTNLSGSIPGSFIPTPGNYNVVVENRFGGLSLPFTFQVALTILNINPSAAQQNSTPPLLVVTVVGGLTSSPVISFNGQPRQTTPISSTQASTQLTAADVATLGAFPVTISVGTFTSNAVNFTVFSPAAPTIISVTPNGAVVGTFSEPLVISGTGFQQDGTGYTGSRVIFTPPGGAPLTLVPILTSPTSLTVVAPQAAFVNPGTATVSVSNVSANTNSGTVPFIIRALPVISQLNPNPTGAGITVTLVVQGSNFANGDTVLISPPGCSSSNCQTPLTTTFNAANNLSAALPGTLVPTIGVYSVYVQTSFGSLSAASPLTVVLGITTLTPSSAVQSSTPGNLVVTSTGGFEPTAVVVFAGQSLPTVYNSPTQVTATLSPANLATAGAFPVYVQNDPSALPSNTLTFTVFPLGQLSSVSPNTAFAGTGPVTIQLTGTGFVQGDVVMFGTNQLQTTFNSSQSLTAVIPATLLQSAGNFTIKVADPSENLSNGVNFSVTLQITSLSPAFVIAGGPSFNLTATLTGGVTPYTQLNYAGTLLQTISSTATSITATVPANLITQAAMPPVFATDGVNISNTVNHLVLGPVTLTSIAPNFAAVGATTTTITLTGIGFDSGSFATVNGTQIPTTFVNSTTLTAQISSTLLAAPATLQVGVTDSHNRTSNQLPFSVLNSLSITSLSPTVAVAGSPQFTLTVNGTGFDTGTVISWTNGSTQTTLVTTFVNSSQVTAIVPATLVATVGTASVVAIDSHQRTSNAVTFPIVNALVITSLNPSSATVGTAVNMVITGTGFPFVPVNCQTTVCNTATVLFGTTPIIGTIASATQINVTIPATVNVTSGTIPVSVQANGVNSNSLPFNATPASVTAPFIYNVTPSQVSTTTGPVTMTVSGINFNTGSVILLSGSSIATTFINANTLTATLPAFSTGNSISVQVVNPNGQTSNLFYIQVNGPNHSTVTLTAIQPNSTQQGSPDFLLTATGSNFQNNAYLTFGSTILTTTQVLSSTQATATVPAALVASPGQVPVWITNPDGTASGALLFTIISGKPVITSLTPPSISQGSPQFSLTVNGNAFKSGAVVSFGGVAVNTTFLSATQLMATIPANLVTVAGPVPVIVTNPDGGVSNSYTFIVNGFTLTSISPNSANAGGPAFTMTLTGTGFQSGATAVFSGTSLSTTFVSSTSLTASVPASLIATGGTANVTVVNPDGSVAGPLLFTIKFPVTLTAINPSTATANSKSVAITATGSGFASGAVISFNGTAITTTFGSATSLSGTIPATLLTATGSFLVTVSNPNGDTSNSLSFTVTVALPLPTITSISPATAPVGSPAITMTVVGTNYFQGSTVQFGGSNVGTTFVSGTQLTANIPASALSQGGTFTVVVVNPDGNPSNAVNFIVVTPVSITSLTPAAAPALGPDTQIGIAGAGIINGATVQFGSATLTPDSTTPTQISVTIPAALLVSSGQVNVTVTNPDGKVSNALTFTIVGVPSITINATITAGVTNQVTLTLSSPAPVDLTGTLVMSFVANAANTPANYVDPAMQFAAGGTSINFTIAKGSTTAVLPGNGAFSPGTVAGTITFTMSKLLSGIDNVLSSPPPSKTLTIAPTAPVVTANTLKFVNASSGGFTIEVIGFSTTRQLTQATLIFTAKNLSIDGGGTFSIDVTAAFNNYFSSATGLANGGAFKLDIPFTISGGDAGAITAVSLSLSNSAGTSVNVSGGR